MKLSIKIWLFIPFALVSSWGQDIPSNIQIIEDVTVTVLDSLSKCCLAPDSAQLSLVPADIIGEKRFFLRNCFLNGFAAKGWKVTRERGKQQIIITDFDVRITYKEEAGSLLGLSNKLNREISSHIKGRIENNSSGDILAAFDEEIYFLDYFSGDWLSEIEKSNYSFTRGKMITFSRWSRFAEPGIVILSVLSMIYLLFSVRF